MLDATAVLGVEVRLNSVVTDATLPGASIGELIGAGAGRTIASEAAHIGMWKLGGILALTLAFTGVARLGVLVRRRRAKLEEGGNPPGSKNRNHTESAKWKPT